MVSTTNTLCATLQNCILYSDYNILCFSFFFLPRLILTIVHCSKLDIIHLGFFFFCTTAFWRWSVMRRQWYQSKKEKTDAGSVEKYLWVFYPYKAGSNTVFIFCTMKISMPRNTAQKFNTFTAVQLTPTTQYLKKYVLSQEYTTLLLQRSIH